MRDLLLLVLRDDGLDAGETDLAAIRKAKGARIDHPGDMAVALRFEGASRGVSADRRRPRI